MPAAAITSMLFALLTLFASPDPGASPSLQTVLRLGFYDSFDRSTYQFSITDDAYVAVFDVGLNTAELTYPAIGAEMRRLRFGEIAELPSVDNQFRAGRHLLPRRTGRGWLAGTRNGTLMKGRHVLIVVSKRPFRFERLNELYEGQGETFRRRDSLGVVDDLPDLLLRTILPDFAADDWDYHLHWIRT